MGQEIVYCFKCQRRIVGAEFAKGQAYPIGNCVACSACAVALLETLPPKDKEQLLARMFKAAQVRQSISTTALKAIGGAASAPPSRQASVPRLSTPAGAGAVPPPKSMGLLIGLVTFAIGAAVLVVALVSGTPAPLPPPAPPRPAPLPRTPTAAPGLSPDEKRREETAAAAVRKAREFTQVHPADFGGQVKAWGATQLDAERTGYEKEARRELDRAASLLKESIEREAAALEAKLKPFLAREEFKAALEALEGARTRTSASEWTVIVDRRLREVRDTIAGNFEELKGRALESRTRGARAEVSAAREKVVRWGLPDYVTALDVALAGAWTPLFDGRTTSCLSTPSVAYWSVQDGAIVKMPNMKENQSGQTRNDFGDGELRIRFTVKGASNLYFAARQGEGGFKMLWGREEIEKLGTGEHELIFTCRGAAVTATVDGAPAKIDPFGKPPARGRVQFNCLDGSFRMLALDFRELP